MLKSLVNVQMNSAVQWLMFRGIQHLLEIEINLQHSTRVCVWSEFSAESFFLFMRSSSHRFVPVLDLTHTDQVAAPARDHNLY